MHWSAVLEAWSCLRCTEGRIRYWRVAADGSLEEIDPAAI